MAAGTHQSLCQPAVKQKAQQQPHIRDVETPLAELWCPRTRIVRILALGSWPFAGPTCASAMTAIVLNTHATDHTRLAMSTPTPSARLARQVRSLTRNGMHASAARVSSLLVSSTQEFASPSSSRFTEHLEALWARGTALMEAGRAAAAGLGVCSRGKAEFRSALAAFHTLRDRLAQADRAGIRLATASGSAARGGSGGAAGSGGSRSPEYADGRQVHFRAAQCLFALGDDEGGVHELEGIPFRLRSAAMHLAFGHASIRLGGSSRGTVSAFKEVLRANPFAAEVVEPLLVRGVRLEEVLALLQPSESLAAEDAAWLQQLARSAAATLDQDVDGAVDALAKLEHSVGPKNSDICVLRGRALYCGGREADAVAEFEKAKAYDPCVVEGMDLFAASLAHCRLRPSPADRRPGVTEAELKSLGELSRSLLAVDDTRAESWVASALAAWVSKSSEATPHDMLDRAAAANPIHPMVLHVRGSLCRDDGDFHKAYESFTKAYVLTKSIDACEGAVVSLLEAGRVSEAVTRARAALQRLPGNVRATCLLGQAFAASTDGATHAVRSYQSALKLDPGSVEAAWGLSQVYEQIAQPDKAVEVLQTLSRGDSMPHVQCRIGSLYASMGDLEGALGCYELARALDPTNDEAITGMEDIQRQLDTASA